MADQRRREKAIHAETWSIVNDFIVQDWSPEQISGWLAVEKNVRISHERIYQHIARDKKRGGSLHLHVRCRKKRKKRYGGTDRRGQIKNRVPSDKRPPIVDERSRIGDWEADTIIGRRGGTVLVTLVERKSRFAIIAQALDKRAESVNQALVGALRPYQDTLACDNGKEFAFYEEFSVALQAEGFLIRLT